MHFIVSQTGWGEKIPVTRNFVQESYTHVKTQFGGDLLRTWTKKMQINGLIEMTYLVSWILTGQQCNSVCQIHIELLVGSLQISRI